MKTLLRPERSGFTLLDLLVVVLVLALLLVVSVPAFGRAGVNSKGLRCLINVRQLGNAWRMYADDNRDRMVYAEAEGGGQSSASVPVTTDPNNPDNYAWSGARMDYQPGSLNRANWDVNYDITRRPLWPYTGHDAAIYKCPEDQSSVLNATGKRVPRVLSMSMNTYLGGFAGTVGGWDAVYPYLRIYLKTTELTSITPAKAFVFTDHRPDFINWSSFMVNMKGFSPRTPATYRFDEFPGLFHEGGAAFSFADGHGELHRWQDARTIPPIGPNGIVVNGPIASPNNPDIAWLQDHAMRPK